MHVRLRQCTVVTVALLTALSVGGARARSTDLGARKFISVTGDPIPRGAYKTWSLFLVTNQNWLLAKNAQWVPELYERSRAFGRVIGDDHLAVWFWKPSAADIPAAENVDVERAIAYCKILGLQPSKGPYLLFTTAYPDEKVKPNAYSVIELGTTADKIAQLLDRLSDQLVTDGVIRDRAFVQATGTDDFWTAWFGATRHALTAAVGVQFRLAIKTPTLSLESSSR
jgi:hypothetical protein